MVGGGAERERGREEGGGEGAGVRLCGNGAHPWEVPEAPVWELCLACGQFLLSQLLSVCGHSCVSVAHSPLPSVSSEPPLPRPSPPFRRCSPSVPSHPTPFLAPAAPDLPSLLSPRFLPLSLLPSSFHPPSPNCASFCLSRASPFHLCLLLLLLRGGGCDPRNISGGEGGGPTGERPMEEQC